MTPFHTIGIIGFGLMGGSLAKALEGKVQLFIDAEAYKHLEEIDALILAVPLIEILEIGGGIASLPQRKNPLVVLDIGSTKEAIAKAFEQWTTQDLEFVATHPMAGKQQNGLANSDSQLFQNTSWIITPHTKNKEVTLKKIEILIQQLGAHCLRMSPEKHDQRAALVSHMPYRLSKALLEFVTLTDPESLKMAGPGFQSITRLAHDNPELHAQISLYNEKNIAETLRKFIDFLERYP